MIGPGARVGALEVVGRIGAGGQGVVYLARPWAACAPRRAATRLLLRARLRLRPATAGEALSWRLAALKVARPTMADSLHDEHAHFAAPGAAHRRLACLYGSRFPDAGQPGLSFAHRRLALGLAYEAGAPLSRSLERWGNWRPPPRWSLALAAQVAEALAHLHGRGVVHHDLRPANLIVRAGPEVVLLDLGAAEVVGAPARRAVYGAPGWLAPERLAPAPAPATPQVDIYAVGALLRLLVPGGQGPPGLAGLIAGALAPDPARRRAAIPSAGALLERLNELRAL